MNSCSDTRKQDGMLLTGSSRLASTLREWTKHRSLKGDTHPELVGYLRIAALEGEGYSI